LLDPAYSKSKWWISEKTGRKPQREVRVFQPCGSQLGDLAKRTRWEGVAAVRRTIVLDAGGKPVRFRKEGGETRLTRG